MVIILIKWEVLSMIKKKIMSLVLAVTMLFGSAAALPENVFASQTEIDASAYNCGNYCNTVSANENSISEYYIPPLKTNTKGFESRNCSENNYSVWAETVKSYIYEDSEKNLWRAEYIDTMIKVEKYTQGAEKLLKTYSVNLELPIFGGIFFGKDYNYVVSGHDNPEYNDNVEVLRVTKYTKDWKKVSHVSVYGANTYIPFHAGSCRMTETSGKLYVDTCHKMYPSKKDGLNHQANMCFEIDESEMKVIHCHYEVWNLSIGYVSHSFNQFIKTDGKYIYRIDHGDAYPRGIPVIVNEADRSIRSVSYTVPVTFEGEIGENYTGASIGGLEVSGDTIIFPYYQDNNILVNITSKDLEESYQKMLTNYNASSDVECRTPQIVKADNDLYVVLWEETTNHKTTVRAVAIDRKGNLKSNIGTIDGNLSDCQPILCNDECIRWYVTDSSSPVFYAIQPHDAAVLIRLLL